MAYKTITTSNTSFLTSSDTLVYAGKNGFTTSIGSIPVLCQSVSANATHITLLTSNIHLLTDDNFSGVNVLDVPGLIGSSNSFIRAPIVQYAASTSQEDSTGYFSKESNVSLEISSYNVHANTITVFNSPLSTGYINDLLLTAPFYITLTQPILANSFSANSVYVSGSTKTLYHEANVVGVFSTTIQLKKAARYRSALRVYVDDSRVDSFTWSLDAPTLVSVSFPVASTKVVVLLDDYTVPAIETNDSVSFSTFNNTFLVANTSYQPENGYYSQSLSDNKYYKIKLNKPIVDDTLSYYIINTSTDLEGSVSNITSNSFTIDYEDSYPYTYSLANSGVYYLFQKNRVRYTTAKPEEYGKLSGLSPQNYIVEATNINRYNRISYTIRNLLQINPIKLSRVSEVSITERVLIDTTGGASVNATIAFPPIAGRDVTNYEILYRVISETSSTVPEFTRVMINQDTTVDYLRYTINNLDRGTASASNTLEVLVTPMNGDFKGYTHTTTYSILGKLTPPSSLSDFYVGQQNDSIIYTWQFAQTVDGYILDLDTKEVEIREYPGVINLADQESINATWSIALPVNRVPFPNTSYTTPVSKYGDYTYLIRVRDTSNNESTNINAAIITLVRTSNRIYKSYNERQPGVPTTTQDGLNFPTSNVNPESNWPSFSQTIHNGLIYANSSNVDNANGSSSGFSISVDTPEYLSSAGQSTATYVTQIRDMGKVIKGSIRIKPVISISSSITYNDEYRLIQSGITDPHPTANVSFSSSVLVDNAFGGIGYVLGYNKGNAANLTYNAYFKTLVSGGQTGNVFAIRNPGQFANDSANANMFAYIAGVINDNAIQLGEVFYANGRSTGSNSFPNVCVSGNTYELIDLAQFLDSQGSMTYLGPTRDITQNIYVRYATSNVFYLAAANGVSGYPGHGNTNPNAFSGASENSYLGYKRYVSGDIDFRYVQIKLEYSNKEPALSTVVIEDFTYEVDIQEKTYTTLARVNNTNGIFVNYSFVGFTEPPKVTGTIYNSTGSYSVNVSNVSIYGCNVSVYQSNTGASVTTQNVSILALGI